MDDFTVTCQDRPTLECISPSPIGWAAFDADYTRVVARSEEPLITRRRWSRANVPRDCSPRLRRRAPHDNDHH